MSDRALIGFYDGHVLKAVYCHNGGDRYDLGRTLLNYYARPDQAAALIELGNLSSVGKRLMPMKNEKHSFAHPNFDITLAYHRDRGEPLKIVTASHSGHPYRRRVLLYLQRRILDLSGRKQSAQAHRKEHNAEGT